jgi:hypothetical protein
MNIIQAIHSLRPGAKWYLDGYNYENLEWIGPQDKVKPSKEEIEAEIARLKSEWEQTQYQRDRAQFYPDLADFADAYYWAQKGDESKMNAYIAKCDEVKSQYPKPEAK